jgi:hypothetical protein
MKPKARDGTPKAGGGLYTFKSARRESSKKAEERKPEGHASGNRAKTGPFGLWGKKARQQPATKMAQEGSEKARQGPNEEQRRARRQ